MSASFISKKVLGALATLVFVICFNFFLFRVVENDPVANLFRGRNLSQSQRAELTKQFGLDKSTGGQFVDYLKQTATLNFGRSYQNNAPVAEEIRRKALPTIALAGSAAILSAVFGILLGIAAAWRRRTAPTTRSPASRWASTRCPTSGWACCCSPRWPWPSAGSR